MICPTCRHVMIVVEHEKIELDYCTHCMGVWFDAGELELLLDRMQVEAGPIQLKAILALPDAPTAEKKRRCPVCGERMKKVNIGEQPKVLIDACTRGEGLWFDGGEVSEVIRQCSLQERASSQPQGHMLNFLGDTLKAARKAPESR